MKYTSPSNQKSYSETTLQKTVVAMAKSGLLDSVIDKSDYLPADGAQISALTNRGGVLPTFLNVVRSKTRTVISFDYIQWTGKKGFEFLAKKQDKYRFLEGGAPHIKNVEIKIGRDWQPVAIMWTDMKAGIDKAWCKMQLTNKFCWQAPEEIVKCIQDINCTLDIEFKQYTRLDVCADFQQTDYRHCTVQQIMDNIAKRKYIFKGGKKAKSIDGEGQDFHAARIEVEGKALQTETIRVGKRSSGVSFSMYNKTKEMKAKEDKPWIREAWQDAGFKKDIDTFRLEFSYMKSASTFVCSDKAGKIKCDKKGKPVEFLQHQNINCLTEINEMFNTLYTKHFVLAIAEKGQRFSRLSPVKMLKIEDTFFIKTRLSEKKKSNNYTKANISNMINYHIGFLETVEYYDSEAHAYRTREEWCKEKAGFDWKFQVSGMYRYIRDMITKHKLHDWFANKFPKVNLDEFICDTSDWVHKNDLYKYKIEQGYLFNPEKQN